MPAAQKAPTDPKTSSAWAMLVETYNRWNLDNVPRLAAAVSFYAALSLAPFVILATVATLYWLDSRPESRMSLIGQARSTLGDEAGSLIAGIVRKSQERHGVSVFASLVSFGVMFFSASNLFIQFDESVQTIWHTREKGSALRLFIKARIMAFASVTVTAAALIGWLFLDSRLAYIAKQSGSVQVAQLCSFALTALVLTGLCLVSMKRLPDIKLKWSDVWPGAILAALVITTAKYLLGLYFAGSGAGNLYGPAGALLAILLWIYYCAQIYFFGVELVYVYSHRVGSLVGESDAVPMS